MVSLFSWLLFHEPKTRSSVKGLSSPKRRLIYSLAFCIVDLYVCNGSSGKLERERSYSYVRLHNKLCENSLYQQFYKYRILNYLQFHRFSQTFIYVSIDSSNIIQKWLLSLKDETRAYRTKEFVSTLWGFDAPSLLFSPVCLSQSFSPRSPCP